MGCFPNNNKQASDIIAKPIEKIENIEKIEDFKITEGLLVQETKADPHTLYDEEGRHLIDLYKKENKIDLFDKNGKKINEIKEINKYEFTHLVSTEEGSSGSPIFLENSIDVIGIHKESNKNKSENYGDFIYPVINIIRKDIREKRNKGKYENGKYIWENAVMLKK